MHTTYGRSLIANVRTPSSQMLNSSQKGGWYGKAFSASNFGPDRMSPTASKMLYNSVFTRREFVEVVNAFVDWIEAQQYNATKTQMYSPAFEEDIMVSSGRRQRSLVDVPSVFCI